MTEKITNTLNSKSYKWLITGVGGFIGSNLLQKLLAFNQEVIGIDNLSTGSTKNINDALSGFEDSEYSVNFKFYEGDITNLEICQEICKDVDFVLHQAALGSIPRSINDPLNTHNSNINGFLNMLISSRDNGVKRFVYASSSSVYGDHKQLPKIEENIGNPLNPYAITKFVNELYASNFAEVYNYPSIGLRYFNVFGRRQDPNGSYAAVIPKWIASLINKETIFINGDGETSRDFCYVENAVQVNILAAITENKKALNQVYNVAVNDRTNLNDLYKMIFEIVSKKMDISYKGPEYRDFRAGDIRHSEADISRARDMLGYHPMFRVREGLEETIDWYLRNNKV